MTIKLSDTEWRDILITAFESGSYGSVRVAGYTYEASDRDAPIARDEIMPSGRLPRYAWVPLVPGGSIAVTDAHGDEMHGVIDRASLERGLALVCDKHPRLAARIASGGYDAPDADAVIQAAAFGEVVYA